MSMNDNDYDKATLELHHSEADIRRYTKLNLKVNEGDIRLIEMNDGRYKLMLECPCVVYEDQYIFSTSETLEQKC